MSTTSESNATMQASATIEVPAQTAPADDFRVYRSPQSETVQTTSRELPESFFTPTSADLMTAQNALSARTQALANAPLQTQAMREAEQKARHAKYPTATIRVRFSDRTQLEKTFPSTNKIRSVYAFVRNSLREDVKSTKFVLYQTPPKRELKVSDPKVRDETLLQLQLAPTAILHLKFEDESLNHVHIPAPLDPAVLARAEDLPIPPDYSQPSSQPSSGTSTPQRTTSSTTATSGTASGKTKVPKWLKLGPRNVE